MAEFEEDVFDLEEGVPFLPYFLPKCEPHCEVMIGYGGPIFECPKCGTTVIRLLHKHDWSPVE